MKTKIFKNENPEELTNEMNEFQKQHERGGRKFFTQYHPIYNHHKGTILYTAMVFYEE